MISPEFLIEDGLLTADDCEASFSPTRIDYEVVVPFKQGLLKIAWERFRAGVRKDLISAYQQFCDRQAVWLEDYALFRALKNAHNGARYLDWPAELVSRQPAALVRARKALATQIDQVRFAQFLFFRQSRRLKTYAHSKGVRIIGDMPFFVSPDSSDVWANPELFLLDRDHRPRFLAGVPPDNFSTTGQLWGNPLYDWDVLKCTGYTWCIERLRALLTHVDLIRLDHFRAFVAAWQVPADAPTSVGGEWQAGPGEGFFEAVRRELGELPFIAEDLGVITTDVSALRERFAIPATRVLQIGFDNLSENLHLPHSCPHNAVVYTGTQDNPTARNWYELLPGPQKRRLWEYLDRKSGEISEAAPELIRLAWTSPAAIAIAPLQDLLNLGKEGRMNLPGSLGANWRWRATPHVLSAWNAEYLRKLTVSSSRSATQRLPAKGASS
jgi:4-alpha-glucanotransferase